MILYFPCRERSKILPASILSLHVSPGFNLMSTALLGTAKVRLVRTASTQTGEPVGAFILVHAESALAQCGSRQLGKPPASRVAVHADHDAANSS